MAGELNNQINQLKIKISNKNAEVRQMQEFLKLIEQVNKLPTVSQLMIDALTDIWNELNF
jgi:hypothetical protein